MTTQAWLLAGSWIGYVQYIYIYIYILYVYISPTNILRSQNSSQNLVNCAEYCRKRCFFATRQRNSQKYSEFFFIPSYLSLFILIDYRTGTTEAVIICYYCTFVVVSLELLENKLKYYTILLFNFTKLS